MSSVKLSRECSDEIQNIGKALCEFQWLCPTIDKSTKAFNYKYADLSTIVETIRPHLKRCDLSFTQLISGNNKIVKVTTILIHSKSGEYFQATIRGNVEENRGKGMSLIQAAGNVITYLKRYSLSAILGIVADEDVDGNIQNGDDHEKKSNSTKTQPHHFNDKSARVNPKIDNKEAKNKTDFIKYGLKNLFFEDKSKYDIAKDYLESKGGKMIDDQYKIMELPHRIPSVEESESWRINILNESNMEGYKQDFVDFTMVTLVEET
jgi:hypothetical protein